MEIQPSSAGVHVRTPLRVWNRCSPPRMCAVAKVACPHRSTSVRGVNHRNHLGSVLSVTSTNAVSDRFNSAATDCIHASLGDPSNGTTPAGFPEYGEELNASTTY